MKKFRSIMVTLGIAMLLSGCSNLNAQQTISEKQGAQAPKIPQENIEKDKSEGLLNETDALKEQRETPDIVGEISEIMGNEMTIKEVNMPQMSQIRRAPEQEDPTNQQNETDKSEEKTQPKAITGSADTGFPGGGFPGGGMPGGGMPGGGRGGQGGEGQTNTRVRPANGGSNLKLEYTGEERTIMIPVGMSITGARGQGEVTFETLQKGNVITVWLDDEGNVERVNMIQGGQ